MKTRLRSRQAGQVLVETILIMVMFVAAGTFIAKEIRNRQLLAKLVDGPWSQLTGMIENGVWGGTQRTKPMHPNYLWRHISLQGQGE